MTALEEFIDSIERGTVDEIKNQRQNRHTHVLVLREVTAPARFTTDGETVNTTTVRMGDPDGETASIRAVELFNRKQPGAERRTGKSVQRDLLSHKGEICTEDYMHPNKMRQNSPESVLFGSAAGNQDVSQRSRVYYNTAYSLRDATQTVRQNTQTAAGDQTRMKTEEGQGTWTPDFVTPGTFLPSVVTLDSAIPEEVMFVLGVLSRTTRYGANESRGGNVRNHVLDVYAGHGDGPSNLEVSRQTVATLADARDEDVEAVVEAQTLDASQVVEATKAAYDTLCERRGLDFDRVGEETVEATVTELRDDDTLAEVMETQFAAVEDYVERFEQDS